MINDRAPRKESVLRIAEWVSYGILGLTPALGILIIVGAFLKPLVASVLFIGTWIGIAAFLRHWARKKVRRG